MKIPSNQGVISIYGSQEVPRREEGTLQEPNIIYNIDEAEVQVQESEKQVVGGASMPKITRLTCCFGTNKCISGTFPLTDGANL
jgi:hypothetical protein